jgi:hypothetical protein
MFVPRRLALPALILALGLSLAGCSAAGSGGSAVSGVAVAPVPAPESHVATGSVGSSGSAASGSAASDSAASGDAVKRQDVTTGTVVIRSGNPISAANRAASIVDAAGGRVDDRNQAAATRSSSAHATLTLRIPSAKLTATLATLAKIGTEESITLSTNDVTTTSEDLNARITALQTSITRLLALEAKATDTADVIALENDIADRQGELESLTAQQRYLKDQISLSTITLRLVAPGAAVVKPGPPSPFTAILAGFSGFGLFFTWLFLALLYLLPWLVLAAVVWIATVFLLRRRRRRRAAPPVE